MISPTKRAGQRTKNRIRENGPVFKVEKELQSGWLLRSGEWFGWLQRREFHVECIGEKFIEKVLDKSN